MWKVQVQYSSLYHKMKYRSFQNSFSGLFFIKNKYISLQYFGREIY